MALAGSNPDGIPWAVRISRANRIELQELVSEQLRNLSEREVLQVLRHPHCAEPVILEILAAPSLLKLRTVRKTLAAHPSTPRPEALRCLEDLTWRDLAGIVRDPRTPAPVRRSAEQSLLQRAPTLTLGERIALSRLAEGEVIMLLLSDRSEPVFRAVLSNSRLTMEKLVTWMSRDSPRPEQLEKLAGTLRWSGHPEVRSALFRHPLTPRAVILGLLPGGSRTEWNRLVSDPSTDPLIAACAARLLREAQPGVDRRNLYR